MKRDVFSRSFRTCVLFLSAVCLAGGIPDAAAQTYDPNTIVYVDALWMRVHAADCPSLILKEHKQTMTLEEADQLGYRIGESGQSGREECCLVGYQRKYYTARNVDAYYGTTYSKPDGSGYDKVEGALIPYDAIGVVELMGNGDHKYHVYGCHRFTPDLKDQRMTLTDARSESGFYICPHCIERGPGSAQMSDEEWAKLPSGTPWTPPAGWTPTPFPGDTNPPQQEIDILLSQTLHGAIGIQESVYINPVATVENFMIMRFFFPVYRWLELYQAYRCTGDTNVLEQLRGSARHYNTLSKNYLSAAQRKAKDPEGMAYMYTMAATARITLQLARKYPSQVTTNELAEAEDFLTTIMSVLQPACEDNSNLDSKMGIPKPLADDFRTRAFNRALNGIGTIGMATAALKDLQVLNSSTAYQSTIDRYSLIIQQYIINWKSEGFAETYQGKDYFSYPYSAGSVQWVGDVKLFAADDQGHFSHSMQGCYVLFDSVPELGVDDAFMTALANTIEFNSHTTSGSPQTPSQEAIRPYSRKSFALPSDRLYLLNAFNSGVIDGQCSKLSSSSKTATNSQYKYRRATLNALYLKALRQDRSLIYLTDEAAVSIAAPSGLAASAGDGSVALDWNDNSESNLSGYSVYRAETSNSYGAALATGVGISEYVDTNVVNGTTYYYVVTAVDHSSNESLQSAEVSATPGRTYSHRYEAENAVLNGGIVSSNQVGYSGTGFVDYQNNNGDYVEWTIPVAAAGPADLVFGYALSSGDRPLEIKVNGAVVAAQLSFPNTGSWSAWGETVPVSVSLQTGNNTVRATAVGSSGANVDYLDVKTTNASIPEGYDQWAGKYGGSHIIGTITDDADSDGLNNLYEYAIGGDPTNRLVRGTLPTFTRSGGVFLYVHPQRADDTSLVYTVETRTNLVHGAWTNAEYTITGTNVTGGTLDFVTNEVSAVQDGKFIRLRIGR